MGRVSGCLATGIGSEILSSLEDCFGRPCSCCLHPPCVPGAPSCAMLPAVVLWWGSLLPVLLSKPFCVQRPSCLSQRCKMVSPPSQNKMSPLCSLLRLSLALAFLLGGTSLAFLRWTIKPGLFLMFPMPLGSAGVVSHGSPTAVPTCCCLPYPLQKPMQGTTFIPSSVPSARTWCPFGGPSDGSGFCVGCPLPPLGYALQEGG